MHCHPGNYKAVFTTDNLKKENVLSYSYRCIAMNVRLRYVHHYIYINISRITIIIKMFKYIDGRFNILNI